VDSAQLCNLYNIKLHTVPSCTNNVKITTANDYFIFRALFEALENQQILTTIKGA
jgi:2-C-methyl-D-erythritol 4-phosphate cytidylyltransferase